MTRHGRLAAFGLALVVLAMAGGIAPARAQVSPGPLSDAHRSLDGGTQCFQCHAKAGGPAEMEGRCLACHKEIGWMKDHKTGFHAQVKDPCSKCHPDHAGRDFQMIAWDGGSPQRFDHRRAGWALEGKHAQVDCRSCHKPAFQKSEAAPLIRKKDHAASWLGLETACASCHQDPHAGTLGTDCTRCHGLEAWRPAPKFNHANTAYALTGAHVKVACANCHSTTTLVKTWAADGSPIPVYKPVPHGECSDCHSDPHAGKFGAACARCHVTTSFKTVNQSTFDHDRTRYPLRGRHVTVACASCHDEKTAWGPKPAFATCGSCHRDAHAGLATVAGKPADCAVCHGVDGFTPSTFTVAQHRASVYPLEGRHAAVECAKCHTHRAAADPAAAALGPARVVMRPPHDRCASCHADPHGGQLATRADHGACESCHTVAGYKPSTFAVAEHGKLRLALDGRHAAVACAGCHGVTRAGLAPPHGAAGAGKAGFVFALDELACTSCHHDPHRGRFATGGARPRKDGCFACHSVAAFRPSAFDAAAHASSGFALEGAHRAVPCVGCHASLKANPPVSTLLAATGSRALPLDDAPATCEGCHKDPHGGQFTARKDHGACIGCHGVDAFAPASRFDHGRDTRFKLDGAHARIACAACHRPTRDTDGTVRVRYRPTPTACAACHATVPVTPTGGKSSSRLRGEDVPLAMFVAREARHGATIH
ncbi:MAG: cytochrome c3 family protein [Candidatus Eisenbacteria bacterium]